MLASIFDPTAKARDIFAYADLNKIYSATVSASGGSDYTTISAAIAAGKNTIFVRDGLYAEELLISTSNITIIGQSRDGVIVRGRLGYDVCRVYANYTTIENITFDAETNSGQAAYVV